MNRVSEIKGMEKRKRKIWIGCVIKDLLLTRVNTEVAADKVEQKRLEFGVSIQLTTQLLYMVCFVYNDKDIIFFALK